MVFMLVGGDGRSSRRNVGFPLIREVGSRCDGSTGTARKIEDVAGVEVGLAVGAVEVVDGLENVGDGGGGEPLVGDDDGEIGRAHV